MAANAVPDVYDPPQARIGRQQLTLAGQILEFISTVRSDSYADAAAKAADLKAIAGLEPARPVDRTGSRRCPPRLGTRRRRSPGRAGTRDARGNPREQPRRRTPQGAPGCVWICRTRTRRSSARSCRTCCVPNSFYNAERTEQRRSRPREAVEPITRDGRAQRDDPARRRYRHRPGRSRRCKRWACSSAAGRGRISAATAASCSCWASSSSTTSGGRSRSSGFARRNVVLLVLVIAAFMLGAKTDRSRADDRCRTCSPTPR